MTKYYCPLCGKELERTGSELSCEEFVCRDCEFSHEDEYFDMSEVDAHTNTEAVEVCPYCNHENVFSNWDVKTQGYIAKCDNCGASIMLCDECFHTDENGEPCEFHDFCDLRADENGNNTCYRRYFKTINSEERKEEETMKSFDVACVEVKGIIREEWGTDCPRYRSKNAMYGDDNFKKMFIESINGYLHDIDFGIDSETIPSWYQNMSVEEAIYQETYGWGPVAEWFLDDYKDSSMFIISGENCFIERAGHQKLMKQRADKDFLQRFFENLSPTHPTNSSDYGDWQLNLKDGTHFEVADNDDIVITRPTPSLVTKQDITLELFSKFKGLDVGIELDMDCVESCNMRKTNSFGITLKDGRQFKVIVKDLVEED